MNGSTHLAKENDRLDRSYPRCASPFPELQGSQRRIVPDAWQVLKLLFRQTAEQCEILRAARSGPESLEGKREDLRASSGRVQPSASKQTDHAEDGYPQRVNEVLSSIQKHLPVADMLLVEGFCVDRRKVPVQLQDRSALRDRSRGCESHLGEVLGGVESETSRLRSFTS